MQLLLPQAGILLVILCLNHEVTGSMLFEGTLTEESEEFGSFSDIARKDLDTASKAFVFRQEHDCPSPFFQVMSECFYVHVHHHLNWWAARNFCQDMGGDLAEPLHHGALLAVVANQYPDGPQHFWLGASDLEEEGKFKWLTGRRVLSGWRDGQPDNADDDEDCLELWPSKYPSFSDKNCDQARAFICQYK
ncbi:hypothetical protein SK128_009930 [Halocaridina rubra]|uniref:C-type lectin domain-containing protein n=1 Tax=Halocaridina rubra TaxID=373956 RepID=A0AAN8WV50_HALRR